MVQVLGICFLAVVAVGFAGMFVVFGLELRDAWRRRR
jgi:hypothetical protein